MAKKTNRYGQLGDDGQRKVVGIDSPTITRRTAKTWFENDGEKLWAHHEGQRQDVSLWLEFPALHSALESAFGLLGATLNQRSFKSQIYHFNGRVLSYARSRPGFENLGLADIDSAWLAGLLKWLEQRDESNAPRWSKASQSGAWGVMKSLIAQWKKSPAHKHLLASDIHLAGKTFHGRLKTMEPVKVLDDQHSRAVLRACVEEIRQTRADVEASWAKLEAAKLNPATADALTLAQLEYSACHGGVFPTYAWLEANDLARLKKLRGRYTSAQLRRPFMPEPRDMAPFVILLAFYTSFNPDTIRNLSLDDIDRPEGFGAKRIRFSPYKGRADRRQIRSFALGQPNGPGELVDFLTRWGSLMRDKGEPEERRQLFAMVAPNDRSGSPGARSTFFKDSRYNRWSWAFNGFKKDHDLPDFNLAQIRKTSLDLVHEITGGDLKAVTVAGGQRNPQVIEDHYTSDAARLRNSEKLGLAMATRERWIGSQGKTLDVRKEPTGSDHGAATPGFHCFDPFSSPVPGERQGRLCQAYGKCPVCPLAAAPKSDPYTLARMVQLKAKIQEAQGEMDPQRWLAAWRPVGERLANYWVPSCADEDSLAKAERMTLPPLPPLE